MSSASNHQASTAPMAAPGQPARHGMGSQMGSDAESVAGFTTHPYKPPQPGLVPDLIGRGNGPIVRVQIMDREAHFGEDIRLMAQRYSTGEIAAKLPVELSAPGKPARGLPVRGPGLEAGGEDGRRFWNPSIRGPLYVSQEQGQGPRYLTTDANDPRVAKDWRVALLSAPGKLEFPQPKDSGSLKVLMAGQEELRNQPGAFLSKAIVAYRVEKDAPAPAGVAALRTFVTVPPKGWDAANAWVSEPRQTDKYRFLFGPQGVQVLNYDGHDAVKLARQQNKLAVQTGSDQRRNP